MRLKTAWILAAAGVLALTVAPAFGANEQVLDHYARQLGTACVIHHPTHANGPWFQTKWRMHAEDYQRTTVVKFRVEARQVPAGTGTGPASAYPWYKREVLAKAPGPWTYDIPVVGKIPSQEADWWTEVKLTWIRGSVRRDWHERYLIKNFDESACQPLVNGEVPSGALRSPEGSSP